MSPVTSRRRTLVTLLLVGSLTAVVACGDDVDDAAPTTVPEQPSPTEAVDADDVGEAEDLPEPVLEGTAFAEAGPSVVGVRRLAMADERRVVVWYPAEGDAGGEGDGEVIDLLAFLPEGTEIPEGAEAGYPSVARPDASVAPGGPFPTLVFSHGFGAVPEVYQYLGTHLASWGVVVVAPDHIERGFSAVFSGAMGAQADEAAIVRGALDLVLAHPDLEAAVDTERLAVGGHSAGTRSAVQAALGDDRYRAVLLQSPLPGLAGDVAGLDAEVTVVAAVEDQVTPLAPAEELATATGARLITLSPAGHVSFTDACALGGDDGGGLAAAGAAVGIEIPEVLLALAADGCGPDDLEPAAAWAALRHLTTAVLRAAWQVDAEPVGLDPESLGELAPVTVVVTGA